LKGRRLVDVAFGQKLTLAGQRGKVSYGLRADM
jgi:hypothetical protein